MAVTRSAFTRSIRRPIRVAVSSRSPAIRAGLRELLASSGFEVADSVGPDELLDDQIDDVDVLVIDLGDERDLLQALGADLGEVPAVVLTDRAGTSDPELAPRAWLAPDASEDALAAAVTAVATGLSVYGPGLAPVLGEALALGGDLREVTSITDREHDVLTLLAAGLPNKAIARQLGISEHTVKFHVGSLLSKLEAQSRTEAVTIAARQGLLTL